MPSKSGNKSSTAGSAKSAMARIAHLMDPDAEVDGIDAIEVLETQHREVERLFKAFKKAEDSEDEAAALAQQICAKLTVHAQIEEEIFYPAAQKTNKAEDLLLEAAEEHLSAKRIIVDLQGMEADDNKLKAKVTVLEEQVRHHVEEEEEELFPKIKRAIPKAERQALGAQLVRRAKELGSTNGKSRTAGGRARASRA